MESRKSDLVPFVGEYDSSYDEYRRIFNDLIQAGYRFVGFSEAVELMEGDQQNCPFVVIRHDVDLNVERAMRIAELERREFGVSSTFFFLVTSSVYNVFSTDISNLVERILELGHKLGLHFDASAYLPDLAVDRLAWERDLLQNRFGVEVGVVSYHCTHRIPQGFMAVSDLIETYQEPFMTKVKYFADSYGAWRFGHPLGSVQFKQGKPLHINFHPMWWDEKPKGQILILSEFVEEQTRVLRWCISREVWGF